MSARITLACSSLEAAREALRRDARTSPTRIQIQDPDGCGSARGVTPRHVLAQDERLVAEPTRAVLVSPGGAYGAFARSLRLPVTVDASRVTASFKNGLLTITRPKTAASKGTAIPIKAE
jgi:hypothetical protein